jgi:rubredoxin
LSEFWRSFDPKVMHTQAPLPNQQPSVCAQVEAGAYPRGALSKRALRLKLGLGIAWTAAIWVAAKIVIPHPATSIAAESLGCIATHGNLGLVSDGFWLEFTSCPVEVLEVVPEKGQPLEVALASQDSWTEKMTITSVEDSTVIADFIARREGSHDVSFKKSVEGKYEPLGEVDGKIDRLWTAFLNQKNTVNLVSTDDSAGTSSTAPLDIARRLGFTPSVTCTVEPISAGTSSTAPLDIARRLGFTPSVDMPQKQHAAPMSSASTPTLPGENPFFNEETTRAEIPAPASVPHTSFYAPASIPLSPALARTPPLQMQFGKQKKSAADILEEKGYWPGEWCCADCGFIYEPGTSPPFEELRARWKCPQCAGPRRRFVKKAGNQLGTLDDSPLIYGTLLAGVLIIGLVYIGLTI